MLRDHPSTACQATDLVVWWDKGYYEQEDEAIRRSSLPSSRRLKQVEVVLSHLEVISATNQEAIAAGQPPDFCIRLQSRTIVP